MEPQEGDFIRLDAEHHTTVGRGKKVLGFFKKSWLVFDAQGERFSISRSPEDDTDERLGWKLAYSQTWSH